MRKIDCVTTCPNCGTDIQMSVDVPDYSFKLRGGVAPISNITVFRISSEQIKDFLVKKSREYVPDVRMTIVPRYCEKKRKGTADGHHSYASLRIAFSENVVEKKQDLGWFGTIGENESNVRFQTGIMKNLIERYQYNRKEIESWLNNYKTLEELEEHFGMTEAYIKDILLYTPPQRIKAENNESWIIFSAAAENVIEDMLTDSTTNKPIGRIQIHDIYPISKDIVEFVVYVHPSQMKLRENPHVRQILLGEEKPRK